MSRRLLKSTVGVGAMTVLSRLLGLVREVVFATVFGATAGMDAFLVAFKIPNFMRRLFAEGAFAQAFVPIFAAQYTDDNPQQLRQTVQYVAGTLALILFVVAVIGMLTSAVWITVFAPGFVHDPAKFSLAQHMLRITFPYLFFISLTALAGGVLNTFSRFLVPAFTPVLLNVSIIALVWWVAPHLQHPVVAAAWGVLLAGVVQLLFQLPFLYRIGMLVWPKWGWHQPVVKRLIKLMVPVLFGASVAQISLLLDTIFASFLPTGSVSWLYYSDRLMQFPLGVFGVALSTVVLPVLAKRHSLKDQAAYNQSLDWALRLVVLLGVPAAVGLAVLSGPLVATLFGYHRFNAFDVTMSQHSLVAFAAGLLFFIAIKVLVSAFYARHNMKTPVKIAVVAMFTNLVFNAILTVPLAHVGLALATSIAACINVVLLVWALLRSKIYQPTCAWWRIGFAVILSTVLMGLMLFYCSPSLTHWLAWSAFTRVLHLVGLIVGAVLIYCAVLICAGLRRRHLVSS